MSGCCVLNVLKGNIKFTGCDTRMLHKYKATFRKVSDRRVLLASKKKLIVQRVGFLLPQLSAIFETDKIMLRKMYLIPADRYNGSPFKSPEPTVSKRKYRETVNKSKHRKACAEGIQIGKQHPHEEWLKMRQKMDEADRGKKTDECICRIFKPSDAHRSS